MNEQRYLVAKYVPDLRRNEPQNIGVILWVRGKSATKFLSEEEATFVNDSETYRRWVMYWNKIVDAENRQKKKRPVEVFVESIRKTQKDNYQLFDGGKVIDRVETRDIESATDFLFNEIVARKGKLRFTASMRVGTFHTRQSNVGILSAYSDGRRSCVSR